MDRCCISGCKALVARGEDWPTMVGRLNAAMVRDAKNAVYGILVVIVHSFFVYHIESNK